MREPRATLDVPLLDRRIVVGVGSAYVVICAGVGVVLAAQGIEWGLIAYANPLARSGECARHGPRDSGAARLAPADTRVGRRRGAALVKAGQVSFAFYLLHALVIQQVIQHLDASVPGVVAAALAAAGLAAWLMHEVVERPGQALLGPPRRAAVQGVPR